ncbi:hypothetical protein N2152v2_010506 [Parachlorella kessleri]
MVSRRFAALLRQPLQAWQTLSLRSVGTGTRSSAYLARWLSIVAPRVERLELELRDVHPPGHRLAISPFLASARTLKLLHLEKLHLLPAELALISLLTSLTSLRCECSLSKGMQPLSTLASLRQLQHLSLTAVEAPSGSQLPISLSALSSLQSLSLSSSTSKSYSREPPLLGLPWAWCQAATQVTSVRLRWVDLPSLPPADAPHTSGAGSSSGASDSIGIFAAVQDLQLYFPLVALGGSIGCCRALRTLWVFGGSLQAAGWAALSSLPHLEALSVHRCYLDDDDEYEGEEDNYVDPVPPAPQSLSSLTCLTLLDLWRAPIHPALTQLPKLRKLVLVEPECLGLYTAWPLPDGPWLRHLESLQVEHAALGSIGAVLRQATRLSSLSLDDCPWLTFERDDLPLLLQLPLERLLVDKRPAEVEDDEPDPPWEEVPEPLWGEESLWVARELGVALRARGSGGSFDICTEEWP